MFQKNPGVENVFALPEEDITIFCQVVARFPVESFMSHSTQFFVGEPFNVLEKIGYRKILCMMGWYHGFPSIFFQSQSTATLCGESFCVSDSFVFEKNMKNRYLLRFFVQVFQSYDSPQIFFKDKMGGGRECHIFSSENFCLRVPKDFVVNPFVNQRISPSKKTCIRGVLSFYRNYLWIRK